MRRRLVAFLLVVLFAPALHAQYFGKNKVQWETFDFKVLHTEHFDIYYYDKEKDVVEDIGRMAERWYERLSVVFQHEFRKKPIVLYANSADFRQTTTTPGFIGEGTGGFTDAFQNRVVFPLTGNRAEDDHVLGHEMVHVFQYEMASRMSRGANQGAFTLQQLPLWLIEGMAEYFSKGRIDPLTAMWIRDATINDRLPDLKKLTRDPRFFPYRYGQAILAYIGARYGDDKVVRLFLAAGSEGLEEAFPAVLGLSAKEVFEGWHEAARSLYQPIAAARPSTFGDPLIGDRKRMRGELNIAPSISPDGQHIAFLSTRELFSIDLFLADARTGKILRKLMSEDTDPHIDSVRFIDSAGSWSPDSSKLAFVVTEKGDDRIAILDVGSRNLDQRISVPGVDAITSPVWSPDGRSIAFSGQATGVSDIFIYDLTSGQVRNLTNDKFSDLQPTYSPDGRTIAFASDRGIADLAELRFGDLQIYTMNTNGGDMRALPLFSAGKQINPQYAPDGSIYFIANPEGISEIFRYSPSSGALQRVTKVATGIAGITELSPAMTVATRTGEIAFSLYDNDEHYIYTLPRGTVGETVAATLGNELPLAALLPPERATAPTTYTAYLQRPREGLPTGRTPFTLGRYRPSLHLTYLGPPTIGVGADRYGFNSSGSLTAYFSDVLGQHNVGLTFQSGGGGRSFADQFGAEIVYLNQERRINWGGVATHIPYVTTRTGVGQRVIRIDGQDVVADIVQRRRDVITLDQLSGLTHYPLSTTRRLEATGGWQRYGFKSEIEEIIVVNNRIIDDNIRQLDAPESLNFFRGALAYVGDSSTFGFISPVRGTRYRFEVEAMTGDLNFQTGLADWRKYFFARPVTFAIRGLHYGRYGADAESERLGLLQISSFVRGYDIDDIDVSECGDFADTNRCPVFDRLVGSKLATASAEVRAPLFGPEGYGLIRTLILPTEILAFADVGVAWTEDESPVWQFDTDSSERVPAVSVGAALRILLSYIPIELYYAKPLHRPQEDWVFGFYIRPGW